MKKLLLELGINTKASCGCEDKARKMDVWGIEGCLARRDEVIGWLVENAENLTVANIPIGKWTPDVVKRKAAGWLVDEAIRRAKQDTSEKDPSA